VIFTAVTTTAGLRFSDFLASPESGISPCCDDERCESVETLTTIVRSTCSAQACGVFDCEYLGYFPATAPAMGCGMIFMNLHQHDFPSLSERSSHKLFRGKQRLSQDVNSSGSNKSD